MISFLKDQKGRLAEANKTLPAIKAADFLLDEEINRINGEIETLESEETFTRKDGYVAATLNSKVDEYAEGTEIKVDALDYTSAGKDDILTVFVNDAPVRVQKFKVVMPSSETI
jgi:viroplasmin and RNaseH domain-containing protein